MSIFWIIAGIAIGYFFKPQLDKIIIPAIKHIKDMHQKSKDEKNYPGSDQD